MGMEDRDLAILLFCVGIFVYSLLFCISKAKRGCLSGEPEGMQYDAAVAEDVDEELEGEVIVTEHQME